MLLAPGDGSASKGTSECRVTCISISLKTHLVSIICWAQVAAGQQRTPTARRGRLPSLAAAVLLLPLLLAWWTLQWPKSTAMLLQLLLRQV